LPFARHVTLREWVTGLKKERKKYITRAPLSLSRERSHKSKEEKGIIAQQRLQGLLKDEETLLLLLLRVTVGYIISRMQEKISQLAIFSSLKSRERLETDRKRHKKKANKRK